MNVKKNASYLLVTLLFTWLVCACVRDIRDMLALDVDEQLIEDARSWYLDNVSTSTLVSTRATNDMYYTPEWDINIIESNPEFNVIETSVATEKRISFVHPSVMDKYQESKDPRYKQTATRYVFRKDKETGESYGFLMTIIPNLTYLETSQFKPFREMTYLNRAKKFGGLILYHDLDGNFINGWNFENGQVNGTVQPTTEQENENPLEIQTRSSGCETYALYEIREICTGYGQQVSMGGMESEMEYWYSCHEEYIFIGYYTNCSGTGNGNVNPPSGGNPGSPGKEPQARTDCQSSGASTRANNARTTFSQMGNSYETFKQAAWSASELSASIYWDGSFRMTNTASGDANSSPASAATNTVYMMHTHPDPGEPPSPKDFKTLMTINSYFYEGHGAAGYNLRGAIVINRNNEYLISITDKQKANKFYKESPNFFNESTAPNILFSNTQLQAEFISIYGNLQNQGYTDSQLTYCYALAFIFDKYNTGLTISYKKTSDNSSTSYFKEVKTVYNTTNYSPTICQ